MDIIIGLIGAKSSGKSTAFEIISKLYNGEVKEITLAGKLKDTCSKIFDIPRNHFDSHRFKEKDLETPIYLTTEVLQSIYSTFNLDVDFGKYIRPHIGKILFTPRQVAQYIGTEVLRAVQPDVHCIHALGNDSDNYKIGVVTDIRFPNEFSFFSNLSKFIPIYIKRSEAENFAAKDSHVSESYLKDLAAKSNKIYNDTTIPEFEKELAKLLKQLLADK